MDKDIITLAHGSGGTEMDNLIKSFKIAHRGEWKNHDNDAATIDIGGGRSLVFTTDSFIVDPIFFPGGNIGHLAVCGTINDIAVMGAKPLGLSLSLVIEEGFSQEKLQKIIGSINKLSNETKIPIVTGDTKVMEKGKVDKIVINTSGVGIIDSDELLIKKISVGDKIIVSGGIGEHAVALLSKRFDYKTEIITDSKPLIDEMMAVKDKIIFARDITRGGLAAVANEICEQNKVGIAFDEDIIPAKDEVRNVTEMLGINMYELACEGRFICIAPKERATEVEKKLRTFNPLAQVIGEVCEGRHVVVKTVLGKRILPKPTGRIVPRIC